MSLLDVQNLCVRYGDKTILDGVNFSLEEGGWLMIVGPNGAGKSTIVNAISQGVPYTGEVRVLGKDVRRYRAHELAKLVGVLAQTHTMGYGFTVGSVVRLERTDAGSCLLSADLCSFRRCGSHGRRPVRIAMIRAFRLDLPQFCQYNLRFVFELITLTEITQEY